MVKFLIHLLLSTEEHFFYHCRSKRNDFFFDMLRNVTCCVTILNWHVTKLVPLANSCSKAQAYGLMFYDFIREETCSAVKRGGRMSRLIFEVLAFNLKLVSFGYFCRPVFIIFPAFNGTQFFTSVWTLDTKTYGCKLLTADTNSWMLFLFINSTEMLTSWIAGSMRRLVLDNDTFTRMRIIHVIVEAMRTNKCLTCFIYAEDFCFV